MYMVDYICIGFWGRFPSKRGSVYTSQLTGFGVFERAPHIVLSQRAPEFPVQGMPGPNRPGLILRRQVPPDARYCLYQMGIIPI